MNTYSAPTISPLSIDLFDLFGLRAETAEISEAIADLSKRADAVANAERALVVEEPMFLSIAKRRRRELHNADVAQARKDEAAFYEKIAFHKARGIEMQFDNAHGCRD